MITIPGAMADPHELEAEWRCVAVAAEMIRNTAKPITFWYHDRASAGYVGELLTVLRGNEAAVGEYPPCFPLLEPISPLRFPFDGLDLLFETTRLKLPVAIGPMAQMGMSAPVTLAGTMAQENAEILAGICITQLIRSGTPVCYGGICHAFDMKTTQLIFSGPEQAIFGVAMTQLGKFYNLPVYINVGLTDSKCPDAQAGMECGITLALGASAGADIFGHMGISGVDQASSLDILIMQNEIISYIESLNRHIDCGKEALALDLIDRVGPGGTFIDQMHTAENFRSELWFPQLLDRSYYEEWHEQGAEDMAKRCQRRKREILNGNEVAPLPDDVEREFRRIVLSAQKDLKK
jgi:trimethylamine--corrinoid protein Co-methyltransferase